MYKTIQVTEGRIGGLFFGASNVSIKKIDKQLNKMSKDGYELVFMVRDTVRSLVFWSRERVLLTFKKVN